MAEVNPDAILPAIDEEEAGDDEDEDEEETLARRHAQESERLRATQKPQGDDDDEYDYDEFDEMFLQMMPGETPQHTRQSTPTSMGTGHTATSVNASTGRQKVARQRRLAEQAGFGDLR